MSYYYRKTEPQLWTVMTTDGTGDVHTDSDHDTKEDAAARVHYLNGGDGLTLRQRYAMAALAGLMSESFTVEGIPWIATQAFIVADEMLLKGRLA
jgi:hypothetical protein